MKNTLIFWYREVAHTSPSIRVTICSRTPATPFEDKLLGIRPASFSQQQQQQQQQQQGEGGVSTHSGGMLSPGASPTSR